MRIRQEQPRTGRGNSCATADRTFLERASYEAGLPLVWELTHEIKKWLTPEKLREFNRGWRVQEAASGRVIEI